MNLINEKLHGSAIVADEHVGMGGVYDTYGGPTLQKENESQNPTPPVKAFFLPDINKKAN